MKIYGGASRHLSCVGSYYIELFCLVQAVLASKINFNLALIAGKSSSELSLTFVNKALSLNPKYVKALLHRATIHTEQEKFEEAVRDYEVRAIIFLTFCASSQ